MDNLLLKKDLTTEQLAMVNSELERKKKSKALMYILWLFTGGFGGHRYYLGDIKYAVAMTFLNWLTIGIWGLVDVFFIGKRLEVKTAQLEREIITNVKMLKQSS